ncbi:AEL193Wp [Eremothecium gossypii ATCC 10895]|uniref:Coatomer subunit gamma n=1 Tax=Eremothecium gossypii (strain ATCC 10895 / CBS 109.51 / FGSC 9923 / NRRL Y-1056) TaxID=284811 RepID=Q758F5_EREGS|nr:AEL193Wp [Eremothecium gossypii ATCC 10895]AAS52492.1 AEL193Wp [Eremothecium gossypii ATCC 10895]
MSTHTYKSGFRVTVSNKAPEEAQAGHLPDKMTVYQDCLNEFNESPVKPARCRMLIGKLLKLLSHGETFPANESTALFFSISKLFQHPNNSLRQAVYLALKELCRNSEDVLMATSSVMKDVQNGTDLVKPNAIRALTRVLDASTAFSAERLYKSAVVSKDPSISSAALVSSYHMLPIAESTVKRYANETQEAVSDLKTYPHSAGPTDFYRVSSYISQYHALGLLYKLKSHDKIAMMKLIQQFSANNVLRNQLAQVQMVRLVHELLRMDNQLVPQFVPQLQSWLTSRYDAVKLEACKLISSLNSYMPSDIHTAMIHTLQGMLSVPQVCSRFAAVRLLNSISMTAPEKVIICNPELESLINDSNRNISTYAITTLLKTGTSKNISSLIKTITKFIHEVSDDFKVIIIDAIRTLSLKFPDEWKNILSFLIDTLKSAEGGYTFKNNIVDALFDLIQHVPQSREQALEHLCDFIEDCEFNEISVRIIYLLGKEGPSTEKPSLYVRHHYNRVVLENSIIRSAAVSALSKFSSPKKDPSLAYSIEKLLKGIQTDEDDEVRDRATILVKLLEENKEKPGVADEFIQPKHSYDLHALESKLTNYLHHNEDGFATPFDASSIPKYTEEELKAINLKQKQQQFFANAEPSNSGKKTSGSDPKLSASATDIAAEAVQPSSIDYAEQLSSIEEFASYGAIIHSSKPIPLTEPEAEFTVAGVKHLFQDHLVLQFNITNTLTDVALDKVTVICTPEEDAEMTELCAIPLDRLLPGDTGSCFISYEKPTATTVGFFNNLNFTTLELDPATNAPFEGDEGFQDEYEIDALYLQPGDYIKSVFVGDFAATFEELPHEEVAVYNLSQSGASLQDIVNKLVLSTNCLPLENSQFVSTESNSAVVKLFGKHITSEDRVALLVRLIKSTKGIALKVQCKSDSAELCGDLANGLVL